MSAPRDFWLSCGHHLLDRDAAGKLLVTDEFLKAYLARPELVPPPEACAAERKLHVALLSDPKLPVAASQIAAIVDADARENWEMMIAWRDHLVKHRTLEAAYLEIVRQQYQISPRPDRPIDAGDLAKRTGRLRRCFHAARRRDVLSSAEADGAGGSGNRDRRGDGDRCFASEPQSPLVALLGLPASTEVDMLDDATAGSYWERSDRFDMALDLTAGQRGLVALGDVVRRWLSHLLAIDVAIEPLAELQNAELSWYVGLSSEATRIGDTLWNGGDLDDAMRSPAGRPFSADVPRSGRYDGKSPRRAGISAGGDDG